MLEVQELTKKYGKNVAVDHVSFMVQDGQVGILLGPNGAGKSTIIKSIAGLLRYEGGVGINGMKARSLEAKKIFGYVPEIPAMFEALTVREHIEYVKRAYNSDISEEEIDALLTRFELLDKQEKLFNRKVSAYVKKGRSKEESYTLARQTLSIPGSGEHCLGLAVDFYTRSYHQLERAFEKTPEGKWLREHAQDYGFTLRYDEGKEEITGIGYEPWHLRYVGIDVARYLKEHNLSLEEFYIEESLYG